MNTPLYQQLYSNSHRCSPYYIILDSCFMDACNRRKIHAKIPVFVPVCDYCARVVLQNCPFDILCIVYWQTHAHQIPVRTVERVTETRRKRVDSLALVPQETMATFVYEVFFYTHPYFSHVIVHLVIMLYLIQNFLQLLVCVSTVV